MQDVTQSLQSDGTAAATRDADAGALAAPLREYLAFSAARPHTVRARTRGNRNIGWLPPSPTSRAVLAPAAPASPAAPGAAADALPLGRAPSSGRSRSPSVPASRLGSSSGRAVPVELSIASRPATGRPRWVEAVPSRYRVRTAPAEPRFRRLEELAAYVRDGEGDYFRDAMQRRVEAEVAESARPRHTVVDTTVTDPRFAEWRAETARAGREQQWVSPRAREGLAALAGTTGQVKPYAMGRPVRGPLLHADTNVVSAMDAYVAKMQCERPSKGVFAPY